MRIHQLNPHNPPNCVNLRVRLALDPCRTLRSGMGLEAGAAFPTPKNKTNIFSSDPLFYSRSSSLSKHEL